MSNTDATAFFYLTAEVRWFRPGRIPQEIRQWFGSGAFPLIPSTRTDRYLVFPVSEHVGIKFREERFEVKALVRDLGLLKTGERVAGKMELWEKWSAGAESVPRLYQDLAGIGERWMDVTKTRYLRMFDAGLDEISERNPHENQPRPEEGCYAEITEIGISGESFWTLGLESFGMDQSLEQNLIRTARFLLSSVTLDPGLTEAEAFAYPAFLRKYCMSGSHG